MNSRVILALLSLCTTSCSLIDRTSAHPNGDPAAKNAVTGSSVNATNVQCDSQAKSKLALFVKPDTYPISDTEKQNAYTALYNECLKGFDTAANNGPKPEFQMASANPGLANLSPAAGGNPAIRGGVSTYPNGMTVIDTSQLSNLSPAAGGPGVTGYTTLGTSTTPNGGTVVVVQQTQPGAVSIPAVQAAAAPAPTHAAAIPVAPVAAPAAAAPATTTGAEAVAKPTKVAHKVRKATTATATASDPNDKRSRFAKNAIPVSGLNTLEPSAGSSLVDSAVNTNHTAQKY